MNPRKPLRRVSKKRQAQLKEYAKRKKVFLEEHPFCFVCWKHKEAMDLHHFFGRVQELLHFVPGFRTVCRQCHDYIERHRVESVEKGWRASDDLFNRPSIVMSLFQ